MPAKSPNPNVLDSNHEQASVVDVINKLSLAILEVGEKIIPGSTPIIPAEDPAGVFVGSLVESVGGVAAGLCKIADAISELAYEVKLASEK